MSTNYAPVTKQNPEDVQSLDSPIFPVQHDTAKDMSHVNYSNLTIYDDPKELGNSLSSNALGLTIGLSGVAITVLFAVYGILVLKHDGDEAENGSMAMTLVTISKYGPTIFLIVFAAIVGSAMRTIATFLIQSGSSIGVLEQLLGSRTISGALFTQIRLRAMDSVALVIIILWCLSPLGSQAALRVVYIAPQFHTNRTSPTAMNTFAGYEYSYAAGIVSDLWGNVRLPSLEALNYNGTSWLNIRDKPVEYTSLVGVPVGPLPTLPQANTTYNLTNSYLKGSCDRFDALPAEYHLINYTSEPPPIPPNQFNKTCGWVSSFITPLQIGLTVPCAYNPNEKDFDTRHLTWETLNNVESATIAECHLSTTTIELSLTCSHSKCEPTAIRSSPNPEIGHKTVLDLVPHPEILLQLLAEAFPRSSLSGGQNPIISYFLNPSDAIVSTNHTALHLIGRSNFELRLTQILNTVLMLGIGRNSVTSSFDTFLSSPISVPNSTVPADVVTKRYIVRCDRAWLSVLIVASFFTALVVAGAMVLQFFTLAPDILGTVGLAMLDREDNFESGVAGGVGGAGRFRRTAWDGNDWTRTRREMIVRLADVKPGEQVGRIGLAVLGRGRGGEGGAKLVRGRRYH
ncbi:hypothetical protein HYALB_00012853 [Hymenoscyphus albidus]|uniref:Uncharacterized protein n=1 Tax=Hymenoscyphus albidus TaxID=595503 RepID=A0A9N9LSZ2_9HELO|nr:hypothetical protein HYALB_00012853 [Hymenoscyphus albidus]